LHSNVAYESPLEWVIVDGMTTTAEVDAPVDDTQDGGTPLTKKKALAAVTRSAKRRNRLFEQFQAADQAMKADICSAFAVKVPARAMEDITGLGESRLYQIRDGK
jgi:hypothetical protein